MLASSLFGFGLPIRAARAIPGALAATPEEAARPGLAITQEAPAALDGRLGFSREAAAVVYRHPSGLFRSQAHSITITPAPGANDAEIDALLVANALPACLWMRGAYMLHAAALRWPGQARAIALSGPSGIGKSTLAAQCLAQGAELIADDSLALTCEKGEVLACGLPGGCYEGAADSPGRRFHVSGPSPSRGEARLDRLLVLHHDERAPGLTRLAPIDALEQVLRQRHRAQVPALLGQGARTLALAGQICRQLAVFAWYRPRDRFGLNSTEMAILHDGLLGV